MKTSTLLLTLTLVGFSAATAQTITDDFSTGGNWTSGHASNGAIAISGGIAGYTTTDDDSEASLMLGATTFSYTSNWEAQVNIHAALAGDLTSPDGYFYGALFATTTGSIINFDEPPSIPMFSADLVRNNAAENVFQRSWWQPGDDFYEAGATGNIATTDAALRLTFDGTDKILEAFYDADGVTGGYTWISVGSIDVDGAQNWGMDSGDTFSLGLVVFAAYQVTAGEAYFDNFSATAIPEPSTYAAFAGLLAIGLAAWQRRRTART
jgi:hypothetical protein